jgi:hypothetical protein
VAAGVRWLIAVVGALTGFAVCWAALAVARVMDTGTQVGLASVPFAMVLAVLGAWAERARERSIDLVGIWADSPVTALGVASVRLNIRNGSELPIKVEELAFALRSKWELPPVQLGEVEGLYFNLHMGTPCQFLIGDIGRVSPHETWSKEYKADLAAVAPKDSRSLYHVWCEVERAGLVDDAGLRWWVYPGRTGRAKRVRGDFIRKWKPPWPTESGQAAEIQEALSRDDGEGDSDVGTVSDGD